MKKEYSKPIAVIQNMTVNSFVAGACMDAGAFVINFNEDSCTFIDDESGMMFFSAQCDTDDGFGVNIVNPNPESPYAQLCYHRPLDSAFSFFNS